MNNSEFKFVAQAKVPNSFLDLSQEDLPKNALIPIHIDELSELSPESSWDDLQDESDDESCNIAFIYSNPSRVIIMTKDEFLAEMQ